MSFNSEGELIFAPSYSRWMHEHFSDVNEYLDNHIDQWSRDYVREEFKKLPSLGYNVVRDWTINKKSTNTNLTRLLDYIRKPEVFVILMLGMPGSGKTTSAYKICELLKNEYPIIQVAPLLDEGTLPNWIEWRSNVFKLGSGDLAIVDEASIQSNARRSGSRQNVEDLGWLAVGRQVGCKMIYISQLSSIADLNITRWSNVIISKGYSTAAAGISTIERKNISENPVLDYLKPCADYAKVPSEKRDWCVVSAGGTDYMTYLPKPHFMSEALSKPYMRYIDRAKGDSKLADKMAIEDAELMRDEGIAGAVIYQQMMIRGYYKSRTYWLEFTGEIKKKKGDEYE